MVVKGKRLTQKEHWQKLKQELQGMDRKQKLEHLWEYYKWVLFVLVVIIIAICATVSSIISANTETIISGIMVNVPASDEGFDYLQDGYYQKTKTKGRQAVGLSFYNFIDPLSTVDQTYGQTVHENVTGTVLAGGADYVMYDGVALPYFLDPEVFSDLRVLFSEEELAAMGSAVIHVQMGETGERIPLAIDIRDTQFYKDYMEADVPIYISFGVKHNGSNKERCRDFWRYIKGGETAMLQTCAAGTAIDVDVTDGGMKYLTGQLFSHLALTVGDHRVEMTEQSFKTSEAVRKDVYASLESGKLDYVLCDEAALEMLPAESLLDLRQVLTEEELSSLGDRVYRLEDGTPVAVDLQDAFGKKWCEDSDGPLWLVFSANSKADHRTLWTYLEK